MKKLDRIIPVFVLIILITGSCVSRKKMTYLQYSERSAKYASSDELVTSVTPVAYKIMANDVLFIRVITPDPQWSSLFNADPGQGGLTMESAALSGYPVDIEGNIEIPYVGILKVAGKTLAEIKAELEVVFKNYVSDAAITIRLVDSSISIIGEVNTPGRYSITKDRLNVFEALSMAGDMSAYGNRQKIQLIRPSPYGPVIKEFSLADRSILTSEFYYLMPNDILYAMPARGRPFQLNTSIYTLFLTSISTALVIISYFRTL